jgi:isopentenyl-diphosphate delta-isomerase
MLEEVILVDANDRSIGTMEKIEAHEKGLLHRAFSILLVNECGEMLLQQRALQKYHSPGLWTNACCSHPRPNETNLDAAHRRLLEELGMTVDLYEIFQFTYHAELEQGLSEHEIDHVFLGFTNENPIINLAEVMSYKWITLSELKQDINVHPEKYTAWFNLLMVEHLSSIQNALKHESK